MEDGKVKEKVVERYGEIAQRIAQTGQPASCCPPEQSCGCGCASPAEGKPSHAEDLYAPETLKGLPHTVTAIALGCGNPMAIADLQPGEVVLDLGSGGGIDCFLAGQQVGPEGRVIGLDMTPEMVKLARRNAMQMGVSNVEFRYGEMEEMPLPDNSVDVIISNCVINLSPDKDKVFSEAFRVLRSGGRLAVSDIVTRGELPEAVRNDMEAWAACVAGALEEGVYLDKVRQAGFTGVSVSGSSGDVSGVASIRVSAHKP